MYRNRFMLTVHGIMFRVRPHSAWRVLIHWDVGRPSLSWFARDTEVLCSQMAICGIPPPDFQEGPYRSAPPKHFEACKAVALEDARDSSAPDAKKIAFRLHLNWDRASVRESSRISVDVQGANQGLSDCVDEAAKQCGLCRSSEEAPRILAAGAAIGVVPQ